MAALTHSKAYKPLVHKFYFDKGFSLLNYVKYPLAALGFATKSKEFIIWVFVIYSIACYLVGYFWVKRKWQDIENDITNAYNPFVRKTLKGLSDAKRFQRKV